MLRHGRFQDHPPNPGEATLALTDPPYDWDWLPQWPELGEWAERALRPRGFLVTYGPQAHAPQILKSLGQSLDYAWMFSRKIDVRAGGIVQRLRNRTLWTPLFVYQKPPVVPVGMVDVIPTFEPEMDYHRWQKPVAEFAFIIERMTKPGDLVLDPCAGSGTVGEACRQLGRRFIGWEADPETYDIAKRRLGVRRKKAG